jgi:hypothetical protein
MSRTAQRNSSSPTARIFSTSILSGYVFVHVHVLYLRRYSTINLYESTKVLSYIRTTLYARVQLRKYLRTEVYFLKEDSISCTRTCTCTFEDKVVLDTEVSTYCILFPEVQLQLSIFGGILFISYFRKYSIYFRTS